MASELNDVWPEEPVVESSPEEPQVEPQVETDAVSAKVASMPTPMPTSDLHALILEELIQLRREHNQKSAIQIIVTMVCFAIILSYLENMKRRG